MKKLPIGIQSFESLREGDYLYVDKTRIVYDLAHDGKYFFLSRPRRFGKSLLLSTLKAYFEGKRNLFEGLEIMQLEKDWKSLPVLHLDLNMGNYVSPCGLDAVLESSLRHWEERYGLEKHSEDLTVRFSDIISAMNEVVVLIDEYDKPLLETIDKPGLQEQMRQQLKSFYSVLKNNDAHIRFAMLTGVSKFNHISIFSGLNNLYDITLNDRYATLCGITEDELRTSFAEHITSMAAKMKTTEDEVLAQLKQMYDGYHFTTALVDVYNPFSLLNAFAECELRPYWYHTGTPSFLIKLLKERKMKVQDMSVGEVYARSLLGKEEVTEDAIALFYQTGYLTIKGYNPISGNYRLGFPNREVETGFFESLLPVYVNKQDNELAAYNEHFFQALYFGQPEQFLLTMQSLLAGVPYDIIRDTENYYQTVLFLVCRLMGYAVQAECRTCDGRIDMVVGTEQYLYVFEFKLDRSAEEALAQIDSKDYMLPYRIDSRKAFKIGVNFDTKKRNIDGWRVETTD